MIGKAKAMAQRTPKASGPAGLEPERHAFKITTTARVYLTKEKMGATIFLLQCPSTNTDSIFFDTLEAMDVPLEVLPGGVILFDSSVKQGGKTFGFDVVLKANSGSQGATVWLFRE